MSTDTVHGEAAIDSMETHGVPKALPARRSPTVELESTTSVSIAKSPPTARGLATAKAGRTTASACRDILKRVRSTNYLSCRESDLMWGVWGAIRREHQPDLVFGFGDLGLGDQVRAIWEFPKIGVPYFGVLIIRILLFRVLY